MASPTVANALADQADENLSAVNLDASTVFSDTDVGDTITYSIQSGRPVGSGLSIDPSTGVISGNPTSADTSAAPLSLVIRATSSVGQAEITLSVLDNTPIPPAPSPSTWPAHGAHWQGETSVSALDLNITQEPFVTWNTWKDLCIFQSRYPSASRVQNTYTALSAMKANNPNLKILEYSNVFRETTDAVQLQNKSSADVLIAEALAENGATAAWRNYDVGGASQIFYKNRDSARVNPAVTTTSAGSVHANFAVALVNRYNDKSGTGAAYNLRTMYDGLFHDSTDFEDEYGAGGHVDDVGADANPDYLEPDSSGGTNPQYYRQGYLDFRDEWNTTFSGNVHILNGGRDLTEVNIAVSDPDYKWDDEWDGRLTENFDNKMGLEKVPGSNTVYVRYSNPANRLASGFRGALIAETMVNLTGTNNLGKGVVMLDWPFEWEGSNPTSYADVPSEYYEAARFLCGISMLHDSWMPCPTLQRGPLPFPYMDELVYDCGDPVGGTPSIGSISADANHVFTIRAADDGGFYWQEFDNVLWVVNLTNYPTGGSTANTYPQGTTDVCTLPSAGTGKKWQFANATYTNPTRTEGKTVTDGQDASVNTGADTGATIAIPRWTARMLVRVDS